jgi:TnpA family transposase
MPGRGQNNIPLVQAWGGGEVASADGLRFVVPVRTLHAGPNPKYFGYERGVTYYDLVSDQFTGLNAAINPERCSEAALHEWQRHVDDRDIQGLQKRAQHYRSAFSHLWVGIC